MTVEHFLHINKEIRSNETLQPELDSRTQGDRKGGSLAKLLGLLVVRLSGMAVWSCTNMHQSRGTRRD